MHEKGQNALFADHSKDKTKRSNLRQEVAEELHRVITIFSAHPKIENMDSYKKLVLIFNQQCEVVSSVEIEAEDSDNSDPPTSQDKDKKINAELEIKVKKKTGGNIIQNPSDPDATYDGHKGVGYQVQICENADSENEVQLITATEIPCCDQRLMSS